MAMKAYACPRCLTLSAEMESGDGGVHTCTPSPYARKMEARVAELEEECARKGRLIAAQHGLRKSLQTRVNRLEGFAAVVRSARGRVKQAAPGIPWEVTLPMTDEEYDLFNLVIR